METARHMKGRHTMIKVEKNERQKESERTAVETEKVTRRCEKEISTESKKEVNQLEGSLSAPIHAARRSDRIGNALQLTVT